MADLREEIKKQFAYYKLVENGHSGNDLVGMVAYALYKKQKVEYVIDYHGRKQHAPSEDELLEYQRHQCTESGVETLRTNAKSILAGFTTYVIDDKRGDLIKKEKDLDFREKKLSEKETRLNEIETDINKRRLQLDQKDRDLKIMKKICPQRGNAFGSGLLQNLIATFIIMAITIVVLVFSSIPSDFATMIAKKLIMLH
jgi:hypothetical protein